MKAFILLDSFVIPPRGRALDDQGNVYLLTAQWHGVTPEKVDFAPNDWNSGIKTVIGNSGLYFKKAGYLSVSLDDLCL